MTKIEFIKGIKYLCTAYNTSFNEEQVRTWYDFFEQVDYETFRNGIKSIIPKKSFFPKISELLEECKLQQENRTHEVIEFMVKQNYFKNVLEYDKAYYFINNNIIPEWFKNDMNKYADMLKQQLLSNTNNILIGNNYANH